MHTGTQGTQLSIGRNTGDRYLLDVYRYGFGTPQVLRGRCLKICRVMLKLLEGAFKLGGSMFRPVCAAPMAGCRLLS